MRLKSLILGAACMAALATPAFAQSLTAITGGRVLTGSSVIENGTVVIQNGRVVSVGTGAVAYTPPAGSTAGSSRQTCAPRPTTAPRWWCSTPLISRRWRIESPSTAAPS